MSSDQPEKLYRYQRFSTLAVESLCHDHLHFADPTTFNDPLDCQPTVKPDSNRETLRRILAELIQRRIEAETLASLKTAKHNDNKASAHAINLAKQTARDELVNIAYHATNPERNGTEEEAECFLLSKEIQYELLKQYNRGVCCFSSVVDDPLLWSHYGDQHRGLCIGYDLNRNPKPEPHEVHYDGDREILTSLIADAILNNVPKSQELLDRKVLLHKASSWNYENEWRLFGNRGIQDSPLALKEVTFGLRCPTSVKFFIIKALKPRDEIKFYEMNEIEGSFKLNRKSADIDEMLACLPRTASSGIELFGTADEE